MGAHLAWCALCRVNMPGPRQATALDCRELEQRCRAKLGDFEARLREYSFEEIKAANAAGAPENPPPRDLVTS